MSHNNQIEVDLKMHYKKLNDIQQAIEMFMLVQNHCFQKYNLIIQNQIHKTYVIEEK